MPLRKCVVCNERKEKRELIRVVKNNEDEVFVDTTGKANGRGAYICKNVECLEKAKKGNRLSNTLKIKVTDEVYNKLEEELNNG